MKVGIIGCGNVGYSTLNAFQAHNVEVLGFDVKKNILNKIEKDFSKKVRANNLTDLISCDIVFECVPTDPKQNSMECDLSILDEIVSNFSKYENYDDYNCKVFVQRSTCPPGTADRLSKNFKKTLYAVNPSFITKATMLEDSLYPKRLLLGGSKEAINLLKLLYKSFSYESLFESECFKTIELFKYIENSTDAVLISLWNEYLNISDSLDIDRKYFFKIMENISNRKRFSSVLRIPSKAFGLWCLPKDISALLYQAKTNNLDSHVLEGAIKTNMEIANIFGINDIPSEKLLKFEDAKLKPTKIAKSYFLAR